MRYLHPPNKLHDGNNQVMGWFTAKNAAFTRCLPPLDLGRLGGEMARRMIDAALAYLMERAQSDTLRSFQKTAFEADNQQKT